MTKHIFSADAVQQYDLANIKCFSLTASRTIIYSVLQPYSFRTKPIFSAAAVQQQDQANILSYSCTKHIINDAAQQLHDQAHFQYCSYTVTEPSTYSALQIDSNRTKHIFKDAAVKQQDQAQIQCCSSIATGLRHIQ